MIVVGGIMKPNENGKSGMTNKGYIRRGFLSLSLRIVVFLSFVLLFNVTQVKQASGSLLVASITCKRFLNNSDIEIIRKLFLGRCTFTSTSGQVAGAKWSDFSHVQIWVDDALWRSVVTLGGDREGTKYAIMEYFDVVVKRAAQLAKAPSNTKLTFLIVNANGRVMARGVIIEGNMIPNFVDPKNW